MTGQIPRGGVTAAALVLAGAAALAQSGQLPVFRGGAVLVTVDAYPEQAGRVVDGLKAADFKIFEDGKPQQIEAFDFVRVEPEPAETARVDPTTVRQSVTEAADAKNRLFVAFLDQYNVNKGGSRSVPRPLIDTINQVMAPTDLFGVMTQGMRPTQMAFARKLQSIEDQLTQQWPWGARDSLPTDPEDLALDACFHYKNGQEARVVDGAETVPLVSLLLARRHEDQALTALEALVTYLGQLRQARTVIFLLSDGWRLFEPDRALEASADAGNGPAQPGIAGNGGGLSARPTRLGDRDMASCQVELVRLSKLEDGRRLRDLMTEANRNNVSFYSIAPDGLAVFDTSLADRVNLNAYVPENMSVSQQDLNRVNDRVGSLRTLAEGTGGIALVNTNDPRPGLQKIVDDMSAYYLLGYYSTNQKFDGRFRKIEVKLDRPGLTIKARKGYVAPTEAEMRTAAAPAAPAGPAGPPAGLTDALAGLGRVPPGAELAIYGFADASQLTIVPEIPSARMTGDSWSNGATVEATVTGPNGATVGTTTAQIVPASRSALLRVPLPMGAQGPWRVSVKVSASADQLQDRASLAALPPEPLFGPLLAYRGGPGSRSPLDPVAEFDFSRTGRVHLEWPLTKSLDERQARLLRQNGEPLPVPVTVTEREVDGHPALGVDARLAPLAPGDYVFDVTASAGADHVEKFVAIRVTE